MKKLMIPKQGQSPMQFWSLNTSTSGITNRISEDKVEINVIRPLKNTYPGLSPLPLMAVVHTLGICFEKLYSTKSNIIL